MPRSGRKPTAGFDFTHHMRELCADMTARLPQLSHIDLARVAMRFCQARTISRFGIQASLTPLRFERGSLHTVKRGRRYGVQTIRDAQGREMLYLLSFYLPRFMDIPHLEKLSTVIHELWHISPAFDGDVRRHAGRCYAHTGSQRNYDAEMSRLAREWLDLGPPTALHDFLQHDFRGLQANHGPVYGLKIATPKLIRVH